MSGLRTVVGRGYREIMAALSGIGCDAIVSAGGLAEDLRSADPCIKVVERTDPAARAPAPCPTCS
jgi:N-glycosyltransferase